MPNFNYKAADQSGRQVKGQLNAFSETDLEVRLSRMGLDLITCRVAGKGGGLFAERGIPLKDLLMFCLQMEQMERGSVPLLESLADLRDSMINPQLREVAGALIAEIEGGDLLSQAMARHPKAFNPVFVSLIRAGEQTGKLAEVFANLAAMLTWQDELLAQTKRLLAYPLFVLVVVLASAGFLMAYLVPQMVGFLTNMGQELPWETKAMVALSNTISHYWWLILPLPFLLAAVVAILIKTSPVAQYRFDYIKLHLPVSGAIMQKIIMARFARYFALMYQTGIPILDAIKTSQEIVANRVVAESLERAWQQINAGAVMSESFRSLGLFPPMLVRMMRVGERTGELDEALLNISYFYDRDVKDAVGRMLQILEPAMTVVLGGLLALIMFAVLGPVYETLTKFRF
ncbi:MAG: type II secretion system F family protein [Nitrosomonadales bacterium]|nr:MAG: type II secretion system F family protein [Nitrosomonadales bacterium]